MLYMMDCYHRAKGATEAVLVKSVPIRGAVSDEGAIRDAKALCHTVTPFPTFFEVRIPGRRRSGDRVIYNSERDRA